MNMKIIQVLALALGLICLTENIRGAVSIAARDVTSGETGVAVLLDEDTIPLDEIARAFANGSGESDGGFAIISDGTGEAGATLVKRTFLEAEGTLADRLVAAVEALIYEGNGFADQSRRFAVVVKNSVGGEEINLGVEEPLVSIDELAAALATKQAVGTMAAAEKAWQDGDVQTAERLLQEATTKGRNSDEIWRRASRLILQMGQVELCIQYLSMYAALNNPGAQVEIRDPIYDPIRERQDFQFVEDSLVYKAAPVP